MFNFKKKRSALRQSVLDSLELDLCLRSSAAAISFALVLLVLIFYPLVISPELIIYHHILLFLGFSTSLLRYFSVKKILLKPEINLMKWRKFHSNVILINGIVFGFLFSLTLLDPLLTKEKAFLVLIIITAMTAGTASSIALNRKLQNTFLISVGIIPSLLFELFNKNLESLRLWFMFMFLFMFYIYKNSIQFYKSMIVRFEAEEALQMERKQLTAALQELQQAQGEVLHQKSVAEYSSKLATLGEMAGGIAHEINNPLNIILLLVEKQQENLEAENLDTNELRNDLKKMELTVTRIAKIIRGLRIFARTADSDPLEQTTLHSILENTLSLCYEKFKLNSIPIKVNDFSQQLTVHCRETQISQVLLNLLNNSFEAVSDLEEKWISIDVTDMEKDVLIRITDSGNGISKDLQNKIFQPFFTTKPVGKGTGLGLSISKGLMQTHQGNLTVDSDHPHTSFIITLPK